MIKILLKQNKNMSKRNIARVCSNRVKVRYSTCLRLRM